MIISSIAGSAAIWAVAAAVALVVDEVMSHTTPDCVRGLCLPSVRWDLWNSYMLPALTAKEFSLNSIAPGAVISVLSLTGGILFAWFVRKDGKFRRFAVGRLQFDPNPNVWGWFLQTPTPSRTIFRVTLKSGRMLFGQISEYSTDPNDDKQEIVMRRYSTVGDGGATLEPVTESAGVLIAREDIELIEELQPVSEHWEASQPTPAALQT